MTTKTIKPLNKGVQSGLLEETTTGAGSSVVEYSVQSDGTFVTLFVTAITGTLTVTVHGMSETHPILLFTFPVISAPTPTLLVLRAPVTPSRVRVTATYTGVCSYRLQGRAVDGGLSHDGPMPDSVRIGDGVETVDVVGGNLQISGEVTPGGLETAGRVSTVAVNSTTWTALPAVPLVGRNAMCVQNQGNTEVMLNFNSATVGYTGIMLPSGAERFYDITDGIPLYAKCFTGSGYNVVVEELS